MKRNVLIITHPEDIHAIAVAEALKWKGMNPVLWHTTNFPSRTDESVLFEDSGMEIRIDGPELAYGDDNIDVVWNRRRGFVLNTDLLHSADLKFAKVQCSQFREGFIRLLAPNAFWVNPQDAVARSELKIPQHRAALAAGLRLPPTLYSNSPERIRAFLHAHGGQIVYKPMAGVTWRDEETKWIPYTAVVIEENLVEETLLRSTPGIYQAIVPKSHELRVTVIGGRVFAAHIHSQDTDGGRLDWRKAYHELRMEPTELPTPISDACLQLMRSLGIVFGCFDFIVTPEGQYVFLEVNQTGQWLFVESYTEMPLLDAFTDFLIQASPDFTGDASTVSIRYKDLEETAYDLLRQNMAIHVTEGDAAVQETTAAARL